VGRDVADLQDLLVAVARVSATLSARLLRVVDALPLSPGVRVLEIGGAPGAAAGEVAR